VGADTGTRTKTNRCEIQCEEQGVERDEKQINCGSFQFKPVDEIHGSRVSRTDQDCRHNRDNKTQSSCLFCRTLGIFGNAWLDEVERVLEAGASGHASGYQGVSQQLRLFVCVLNLSTRQSFSQQPPKNCDT
jgi:hypothetical protein